MKDRRTFLKSGSVVAAASALAPFARPEEGGFIMTTPSQPACRPEKDTMGEVCVPAHMHSGAGTQRAVENFPISGIRFPRRFIPALGLIKGAAAQVNKELGLLKPDHADAIVTAAREVAEGKWDQQFVVDIFQTGSGTSTHMNTNEVLSSRANELLAGNKGARKPVVAQFEDRRQFPRCGLRGSQGLHFYE